MAGAAWGAAWSCRRSAGPAGHVVGALAPDDPAGPRLVYETRRKAEGRYEQPPTWPRRRRREGAPGRRAGGPDTAAQPAEGRPPQPRRRRCPLLLPPTLQPRAQPDRASLAPHQAPGPPRAQPPDRHRPPSRRRDRPHHPRPPPRPTNDHLTSTCLAGKARRSCRGFPEHGTIFSKVGASLSQFALRDSSTSWKLGMTGEGRSGIVPRSN